MSKSSSHSRVAKPVRVSPLLMQYVPALAEAPASVAKASSPVRTPLRSKSMFGMTVNRFRDGMELVYSDGRKITDRSHWGLLFKMFRGGIK
jgi:hypothetical protein